MATFTTTLSDIADQYGAHTTDEAQPSWFGLERYPAIDDAYRVHLNKKIIDRFWLREIGFETVEMFCHHMRRTLNEIMPYYNQLIKTTLNKFDPFETIRMDTVTRSLATGTITGVESSQGTEETDTTGSDTGQVHSETSDTSESTTVNDSEAKARSVSSEHPQTRLNGFEDYATSSQDSKSENTSTASVEGESESVSDTTTTNQTTLDATTSSSHDGQSTTDTEQNTDTSQEISGSQGSKSVMLQEYRDTILNVDVQILTELERLFMGVWDNGDSYTTQEYYGIGMYSPIW